MRRDRSSGGISVIARTLPSCASNVETFVAVAATLFSMMLRA